jgi:hypothetical protein
LRIRREQASPNEEAVAETEDRLSLFQALAAAVGDAG